MSNKPEVPEDITPAGYFDWLSKDRVNRSTIPKMSGMNAMIQFEITDDGNQIWNIIVENGVVRGITKEMIEKPTCTFKLSSFTFLSILSREITIQQAFFKGKMDIKGDVLLALRMNNLVNQR
ncbi:MAG: SCP2 sterol-binding domain-containing protein [Candidatus Brocadiaceae bacterium]|nr:SCP2 sterol-binding domain-containing protein [Candidatus Brocadiaceae bacterium]